MSADGGTFGGTLPLTSMRLAVLLVLAATVAACAPGTRTFDPTDDWALQREFLGRSGVVELDDGRRVRATGLRVDPDSASWVDADTGGFEVVPTASLVRIERRMSAGASAGRGAREGALSGALAGVLLGGLVGSEVEREIDFDGESGGSEGFVAAFAFLGGLLGALDGALLGAAVGALVPTVDSYVPAAPAAGETGETADIPLTDCFRAGLRCHPAPALGLWASDPLNLRAAP